MHDLRSFLRSLEERGELVRVRKPVDRRFELPALIAQLELQGKAYIFENVIGAGMPLFGGTLNRIERLGLCVGKSGVHSHRDFSPHLRAAHQSPLPHRVVSTGPCKEVVLKEDQIRLQDIPVPTFFELDSGAFITGAVGFSRNPDTGHLNTGFYRTLITGQNTGVVNASSMSDLRRFYAAAEKSGQPMPIALAIGVDPAILIAAASKPPPGIPEIDVAGALKGQAIDMVKCETSDLLVPADAEIILEGVVDFSQKVQNTLGEFANQYGPETAPTTRVTTITRRKDAMFYNIMAGRHPEHNIIGAVAIYGMQTVIEAELRRQFSAIREINVACEPRLGTMMHMFISIEKTSDEQPGELIDAAFKTTAGIFPVSMITKRIVVVDTDVDVYDLTEVEWAIWSRLGKAGQIRLYPETRSWELERCTDDQQSSVRVGIDATKEMVLRDKLIKPIIPGARDIKLADYI